MASNCVAVQTLVGNAGLSNRRTLSPLGYLIYYLAIFSYQLYNFATDCALTNEFRKYKPIAQRRMPPQGDRGDPFPSVDRCIITNDVDTLLVEVPSRI